MEPRLRKLDNDVFLCSGVDRVRGIAVGRSTGALTCVCERCSCSRVERAESVAEAGREDCVPAIDEGVALPSAGPSGNSSGRLANKAGTPLALLMLPLASLDVSTMLLLRLLSRLPPVLNPVKDLLKLAKGGPARPSVEPKLPLVRRLEGVRPPNVVTSRGRVETLAT